MATVGTLSYKITGDTTGLDSSLKKTDKQVKKTAGLFSKFGKELKAAVIGGSIFIATKKILALGAATITAASDAEETANKFNVVFSDISEDANEAAENLETSFGLSSTAARTLLGDTGDLLTGFGFTQEASLELSDQVNQLAVDLASFTNFSGGAEGASQALTKALLGERESVKALGISILDVDVKKQVAINTAKGLVFETERQAKAQATLDIALSQSKNAIGDFERSQDSFANQSRVAKAETENLAAALGTLLLPAATDAVTSFGDLAGKLAEVVEEYNNIKEAASDTREAYRDAGKGIGETATQIKTIETAIKGYKDQIRILQKESEILSGIDKRANIANIANIRSEIFALDEKRQELELVSDKTETVAAETEKNAEERAEAERVREEELKNAFIQDQIDRADAIIDNLARAKESQEEYTQGVLDGVAERQAARAEEQSLEEMTTQAIIDRQIRILGAEKALLYARGVAYSLFFGGITELIGAFGIKSREQFIAQQAFAAATAAINSYLAFTAVLADPALLGRPFFRIPAAAGVLAAGLAQQVKIATTEVPQFANGGIVPGSSFSGDNIPARVNSGEMVLNKAQQSKLFDMANGNGLGGNITIKIGNTDFAKAVVNSINSGRGGIVEGRVVV